MDIYPPNSFVCRKRLLAPNKTSHMKSYHYHFLQTHGMF